MAGILYLQRIIDNRLTVPPPMRILDTLCGNQAANHLIFVTTHWDQIEVTRGRERERQFRGRVQSSLRAGARIERFDMKEDTAWRIIESIVST